MPVKSAEIKAAPRRWFRFYSESLNDPKVQKLPGTLFKTWVNLLSLACEQGGVLPSREDIAFQLRMSDHDAQSQIDELIGLGLIDIRPDKSLEPHNWLARQYVSDGSAERTRKYRERKKKSPSPCDVTGAVTVTPPEAESEADTETDPEAEAKTPAARLPDVSDLKQLSDRLHDVAGGCLTSRAVAPGLASMMVPQMWLDQGCDLERDIVPAIQAVAARGRTGIAAWDYFTRPVAEAKARRLAGLPTVDLGSGLIGRKRLDLSKLVIVDSPAEAYR